MSEYDHAVNEFLAALRETPELWHSIDIRAIAVLIDEQWHNVLARCRIDSRVAEEVPDLDWLPEGEELICLREVRNVSALSDFLLEIKAGCFKMLGREIHVREVNESLKPAGPSYRHNDSRLGVPVSSASRVHRPAEFIAHTLTLTSSSSARNLSDLTKGGAIAIDRFLRSLEHPWDGIDGLARVALSTPTEPSRVYQPRIEIVAPLGVTLDLDATQLKSARLMVGVFAESLEALKRSTVGYIADYSNGSYKNGTLQLKPRRGRARAVRAGFAQVKLGAARKVTLLLKVGSHLVENREVLSRESEEENIQGLAYQLFDPRLQVLRSVLGRPEALAIGLNEGVKDFERAVARLFTVAGLSSDALSTLGGLQDAVDVVASTPDGTVVLAVECTLGALNTGKGKPGKLVHRVDQLRQQLRNSRVEILPVMATCRPRSGLSKGDLEYVSEDGIVVLAQDDLLEIAGGVEDGWGADETVSFCRDRIKTRRARSSARTFWDMEW
jgi:hypothetical protein